VLKSNSSSDNWPICAFTQGIQPGRSGLQFGQARRECIHALAAVHGQAVDGALLQADFLAQGTHRLQHFAAGTRGRHAAEQEQADAAGQESGSEHELRAAGKSGQLSQEFPAGQLRCC